MRLNEEGRGIYCGHEFVNLQLEGAAKNLMFATCNLGAEKETDYGEYYLHGCTTPYLDSYRNYSPNEIRSFDDVCKLKMGGLWRMPTKEELQSLIRQTKFSFTSINRVRGAKFSKTVDGKERYVFFPFSGYYGSGTCFSKCSRGYAWASTRYGVHYAYYMYLNDGYGVNYCTRYVGMPIRGVFKPI